MEEKFGDQRWLLANSTENTLELREDDGDEEEEALSLSDLPLIHQSRIDKEVEDEGIVPPRENENQEDFDFCSFTKEPEMCAADEVFFQGQILPLRRRHSVSSEKGSLLYSGRSVSRSESMDHYYSGRLISSRSSSISSHQSSSSGSSSAAPGGNYRPRLPPRNHFHSHPSPSPKLQFPSHNKQGITTTSNHRNSVRKSSTMWSILKLGLVTTPPEIALQDLKTRCPTTTSKNFGSRNSTSSNASSSVSSSNKKKKKKARAGLLGGCKCSADAVDTVRSRVVLIKRSASGGDVAAAEQLRQENVGEMKPPTKITKKQAAKKQLSHHRTFEWLKQLSVEATADEA